MRLQFGETDHGSEARAARAYAILSELIATAAMPFYQTAFGDAAQDSDLTDTALADGLAAQGDDSWRDELLESDVPADECANHGKTGRRTAELKHPHRLLSAMR